MKKFFCILGILFFSFSAFSLGAGVQISAKPSLVKSFESNINPSFAISENISGSFKMERIPIVISGGIDSLQMENIFCFGLELSGDYLFFEKQIKNFVNWYGGAGITGSVLFDKNFDTTLKGGLRFLLGVNAHFFTGYLELYAQEVFSPEVMYIVPAKISAFVLEFPTEIGLRFHF